MLTYGAVEAMLVIMALLVARIIERVPPSAVNIPNRDYWLADERRRATIDYVTEQFLWIECLTLAFLIAVVALAFVLPSALVVVRSLGWPVLLVVDISGQSQSAAAVVANGVVYAGALDGKLLSREDLTALAELPSRDVLLGKLVYVMAAVPTSFVTVLNAVQRDFVQLLNAYAEKKKTLN